MIVSDVLLSQALDALPEALKQAIHDIHLAVQSPHALITSSVLCALSSAVQGHIDVETIYGAMQPVSLFSVVVADSGERKSSTDKLVSRPLLHLEQEVRESAMALEPTRKVEKIKWQAELSLLKKQWLACLSSDQEKAAEIAAKMRELVTHEPGQANTSYTILNDVTPAALFCNLAGNGNAITLASSDAGNLLARTNMDFISNVNKIWDGENVTIVRKSGDQIITNGRLTLSLMLQPDVLKRISERKRDLLRLSGYFARMLVTMPESTQGYRLSSTPEQNCRYLQQFHDRLARLAKESVHHQAYKERVTLRFTPEALSVMQKLDQNVEAQLRDTAALSGIRDAGSKIVNNATRIAALLHVYQHGVAKTEIDASTAHAAQLLSGFYLKEFSIIFGEKTVLQRAEENAALLYKWFKDNKYDSFGYYVVRNRIMQYGPNRVRKRDELDLALEVLIGRRVLLPYWSPNGKVVGVVWNEFPPQPQPIFSPPVLYCATGFPV